MKYFEVDFRKGSFNDTMGRTVTIAGGPEIKRGDKGNFTASGLNKYLTYSSQVLPNNAYTVVAYIKIPQNVYPASEQLSIISSALNAKQGIAYSWGVSGNKIYQWFGTNNFNYWEPGTTRDKNYHCVILTTPGSAQTDSILGKVYIDGNALNYGSGINTAPQGVRTIFNTIGISQSANKGLDMLYLATYDHIFTEQERANAYRDFLNSYPQGKDKYACGCVKPMDLSREKDNTITDNQLVAGTTANYKYNEVANWALFGTNTKLQDGNAVKITYVDSSGGAYQNMIPSVTVNIPAFIANNKYRVRFRYKVSAGASLNVLLYAAAIGWYNVTATNTDWIEATTDFTYVSGSVYFQYSMRAGESAWLEVLEFRSITGLVAAYNFIPNGNILVDISGNGKNGTIYGAKQTKKGLKFFNTTGLNSNRVQIVATEQSLSGAWTINTRLNSGGTSRYGSFLGRDDLSSLINFNAMVLRYNSPTSSVVDLTSWTNYANKDTTVSIIADGTGNMKCYIDGILTYNANPSGGTTLIYKYLGAMIYSAGTGDMNGELFDLRIYNRALTLQEIKAYHNQFVSPSLTESFDQEGADGVAKVPSGWVKQSGSFKIGEHTNTPGNRLSSVTVISNGWGTSGGDYIYTTNASTSLLGSGSIVVIGKKYRIKFYVKENLNNTAMCITDGVTTYLSSTPLSVEWQSFDYTILSATALYFRVDAGQPSGYVINSMTVEEISPLPTFKPGTKYLECVTAGTIAIPSKQAYGVWEFDWYKGADGGETLIGFIASKPLRQTLNSNAYWIEFQTTEALQLERNVNTLCRSVASYMTINTWYRIKITRSLSGVFTLFIKGGAFTPTAGYDGWTLVSTLSGIGTNPTTDNTYTTSEYFVLDIDAGDRVTNINLWDGIKQL